MNPPLRVFNVGNTNVQSALWDGASFSGLDVVPTASFDSSSIPEGGACAVASVVPSLDGLFRERGAFLLSPASRCGLDLSKMDVSTIGADRLANAIALAAGGRLPAVCVDFGTAITFEILDEAPALLGGAILPGRNLQRRALNERTAKLPFADISTALPAMPGRNTMGAIALGVDLGVVGAVRELLASTASFFPGRALRAVACGGDAPFFLRAMPGLFEPGGDFFTLSGLVKAWELNRT